MDPCHPWVMVYRADPVNLTGLWDNTTASFISLHRGFPTRQNTCNRVPILSCQAQDSQFSKRAGSQSAGGSERQHSSFWPGCDFLSVPLQECFIVPDYAHPGPASCSTWVSASLATKQMVSDMEKNRSTLMMPLGLDYAYMRDHPTSYHRFCKVRTACKESSWKWDSQPLPSTHSFIHKPSGRTQRITKCTVLLQ